MKKTTGEWTNPQLRVECPYCGETDFIDVTDVWDWQEKFELLGTAEADYEHKCDNEECGKVYLIEGTQW